MIHLENGHIYELTSDFDIYSCDDGKITVKAGAVFVAERGNNRIINGRELPFYNIYFTVKKLSSLFIRLYISINQWYNN